MVLLFEDLPDLVIDHSFSYLSFPGEVFAILASNSRLAKAIKSQSKFETIFLEARISRNLPTVDFFERTRVKLPKTTKSTIALAFSSDGQTLASTHGDHTVKLINVANSMKDGIKQPADGCILAELEGHPRTPWTVKFHPTNPNLVASGCLGGELRLWDTITKVHKTRTTLPHPVISLSFHPNGRQLAAAAGTMLYLWDFTTTNEPQVILNTAVSLRCVRFLDNGRLLVGVRSRTNTTGVTNYIRAARAQLLLYNFDEEKVKGGAHLSNPTVVVRRALLYNDAGLDVVGDTVLTCAEFWENKQNSGGGSAARQGAPLSPLGAHDFVGGGDAEAEQQADEEDRENEKLGHERKAHLVQVQLDKPRRLQTSSSVAGGAGKLVLRANLEGLWAGSQTDNSRGTFVTSVKLSPTGEFILLGCSRGNTDNNNSSGWNHPVAAVWRLGDMKRMSTLTSRTDLDEEDDANVALFHPQPGDVFVYFYLPPSLYRYICVCVFPYMFVILVLFVVCNANLQVWG